MTRELKERIKAVCTRHFFNAQTRETIILSALSGWEGLTSIDLTGNANEFTTDLVHRILPPKQMQAVLEELKAYQGDHSELQALIEALEHVDPGIWLDRVSQTTPQDPNLMWETLASMPLDQVPERGSVPVNSFFRLEVNPEFVGRESELLKLAASMNPAARRGSTVAIAATGLGGIGKTQLAAEFCHSYGRYFPGGVYWLNFESEETARTDLIQIAPQLNKAWEALDVNKQIERVLNDKAGFAAPLPRLLVFDNLEDPQLLETYRPKNRFARILCHLS
ncbi:MAG: hypothetical protein AAF633_24925 [Chloroflexota bacterium]